MSKILANFLSNNAYKIQLIAAGWMFAFGFLCKASALLSIFLLTLGAVYIWLAWYGAEKTDIVLHAYIDQLENVKTITENLKREGRDTSHLGDPEFWETLITEQEQIFFGEKND